MSNHEMPSDKRIYEMSEVGIDLLEQYLQFYQPTLETTDTKDPFALAKDFQTTINSETNLKFQLTMGFYGKDQLNQSIPDRMLANRLAIVTNHLFALSGSDLTSSKAEDYKQPVLVSGAFEFFSFAEVDNRRLLLAEFALPKFLRPRLSTQSPAFAEAKRLAVPVDAISARIYDPETFFDPDLAL